MTSTVYIAKNVYGGDGLGRLGDGRVIFVPGAWAGEQVKAEITEEKRNYVKSRLVEIVEPSPYRIDGSAKALPGMVYANVSYDGEMKAKESQLREFLERARIEVGGGVHAARPSLFDYCSAKSVTAARICSGSMTSLKRTVRLSSPQRG